MRKGQNTSITERSNVEHDLWRKKVDNSLFRHKGTVVPKWVASKWGLDSHFPDIKGKLGKNLGKTTGWIHKRTLEKRGVHLYGGVSYDKIDDAGLHIIVNGKGQLLEADKVVICAGQVSLRDLEETCIKEELEYHVLGGAYKAQDDSNCRYCSEPLPCHRRGIALLIKA